MQTSNVEICFENGEKMGLGNKEMSQKKITNQLFQKQTLNSKTQLLQQGKYFMFLIFS